MSGIHSLVTEDTANFIDTLHTTDDKAFQVKLSRDTKYHINVLGIVVGDKWTGSSTTSFIVKNRCFHFKETFLIKVTTDFRDDFWTSDKALKAFTVRNQVKVTFTVNCFNVCQTVEFLW